jgi:hypothetical protein
MFRAGSRGGSIVDRHVVKSRLSVTIVTRGRTGTDYSSI